MVNYQFYTGETIKCITNGMFNTTNKLSIKTNA